jgi:hypothetical protein
LTVFLYKSSLASAELPLELRYTPKYLYPFALSIGTLLKSFNLYKPKIKTLLHIFDHTVKPVLLYGSEVWGTSMVNKIKIP